MTDAAVRVHRLGPGDAEAWATLRCELWPARPRADFLHEARVLATAEGHAGFVAILAGRGAVGICEVALREHAEGCTTNPVAFLEGWYVRADCRRLGMGRALLTAAITWARNRGCREFASDTALGDEPALLAHLALGFQEVARVVCLRLPI